jgi:hypothetical protein
MIEYHRDDVKKRITLIARGEVTLTEILEAVTRQVAEGVWGYNMLYDARLRRGALTSLELKQLAAVTADHMARVGPRGRVAFVVPDEGGYAMAVMYAIVGARLDGDNAVFRNWADAERWLDEA